MILLQVALGKRVSLKVLKPAPCIPSFSWDSERNKENVSSVNSWTKDSEMEVQQSCREGNVDLIPQTDQREHQQQEPHELIQEQEIHQSQPEQQSQQEMLQAVHISRDQHQYLPQLPVEQTQHQLRRGHQSPRDQKKNLNPLWLGRDETIDAGQKNLQSGGLLLARGLMQNDFGPSIATATSHLALAPASPSVAAAAVAGFAAGGITHSKSFEGMERKIAPASGALQRWKSAKAVWLGQGASARPNTQPVAKLQTAHVDMARATSHLAVNSLPGARYCPPPALASAFPGLVFAEPGCRPTLPQKA